MPLLNRFWGWGSEDDDFRRRLKGLGPMILHPETGKYLALSHKQAQPNRDSQEVFERGEGSEDGLLQASYRVTQIIRTSAFTHIKVML